MTIRVSPNTRRIFEEDARRVQREAEVIWRMLPPDPNAVRHCRELVAAIHGRDAS